MKNEKQAAGANGRAAGRHESDLLKREGAIEERSRVLDVMGRHAREFRSRNIDIDQRVAAAIEEIVAEIKRPPGT
jgi:hypothetical protein